MRGALKTGGRCAIFTTNRPHGLVDLAARFSEIPPKVEGPLRFGPTVLKPYFDQNFKRYDIHHFHNVVTVPSTDILIEFYRQTTYAVLAQAYRRGASHIDAIDKRIASYEARRIGIVREIERRNERFARDLDTASSSVIDGEFSEAAE